MENIVLGRRNYFFVMKLGLCKKKIEMKVFAQKISKIMEKTVHKIL